MQAHLSEGAIEVDVATDEHIPHIRVLHLTEHLHPILKKKKVRIHPGGSVECLYENICNT